MSKISVDLGKGLTFNGNKITTNWEMNDNITKNSDGLFVPDLSGASGGVGGSTADEITIHELADKTLEIKRDVVQWIHSMCVNQVTNRSSETSYTVAENTVKTIDDIRDECNANSKHGIAWTQYVFQVGDLFSLRGTAHPVMYTGWRYAMDDGNRYTGDYCWALFVVTGVTYPRDYYASSLSLKCLYSATSSYVKGTTYTSSD